MIALVAFATLLGAGGIAFGYFVVLPAAIHFLTNYDSSYYTIQLRAKDYYRFVSFVLVGVAIAFEVPVFVLGLVRLRIVTAAQLRHTWRYGIFAMTVIGVILPGVDPVTTILTVLPLVALYALSIGLATFFEPRWRGAGRPQRRPTVLNPYPKIELHVHLEATVGPETLLEIAKRNGETLPADTVEGPRELYRFRDFDHFIEVWILTTNCLRTEADFRQVVVDYARGGEAARRCLLRGNLLADRAHLARHRLGRDLQRLLRRRRRRRGSSTASRCA